MADYPSHGSNNWDDDLQAYIEGLPVSDGPFKAALLASIGEATTGATGPLFVTIMDSISRAIGNLAMNGYGAQAIEGLTPAATLNQAGVNGRLVSEMATATYLDPIKALYDPARRCVIYVMGGTNDYNTGAGASGASVAANIATICTQLRTQGWEVIVATTLPSKNLAAGDRETKRQAGNAIIRANWQSYADALADVGADAIMGDPASVPAVGTGLSTYYIDEYHPSAAGHRIIAGYVRRAMRALGFFGAHDHVRYMEKFVTQPLTTSVIYPDTGAGPTRNRTRLIFAGNAGSKYAYATIAVPAHFTKFAIRLVLANETYDAGAVRFQVDYSPMVPGVEPLARRFAPITTTVTPRTDNGLIPVLSDDTPNYVSPFVVPAGAVLHNINFERVADDAADTLAGDVSLLGVLIDWLAVE